MWEEPHSPDCDRHWCRKHCADAGGCKSKNHRPSNTLLHTIPPTPSTPAMPPAPAVFSTPATPQPVPLPPIIPLPPHDPLYHHSQLCPRRHNLVMHTLSMPTRIPAMFHTCRPSSLSNGGANRSSMKRSASRMPHEHCLLPSPSKR